MTYLPDVNVWIALAAERHTLHRAARYWFSNLQDEKLTFWRLTQLGFPRLLTNQARHAGRGHEARRGGGGVSRSAIGPANRLLGRAERTPRSGASVHSGPIEFAEPVDRRVPLRLLRRRSIDAGNVRREDPNE